MTASLVLIPDYFINLTPSAMRTIVEYQDVVFTEVLDLKHPLLLPQQFSELSYVIVPLVKQEGTYHIYLLMRINDLLCLCFYICSLD